MPWRWVIPNHTVGISKANCMRSEPIRLVHSSVPVPGAELGLVSGERSKSGSQVSARYEGDTGN